MSEIITDIHRTAPTKVILPAECSQGASQGFKGEKGIPFRKYHFASHVAMAPDRGFTKQLKALDPTLEVLWNGVSEYWSIWCRPVDGVSEPYHVLDVCTTGKTYRELGQDVLLQLQRSLKWRAEGYDVIGYLEEHNNQIRRRHEKTFRDKIKSIALDSYNFVHGVLQVQVPRSARLQEGLRNDC